jgi:hypothetical protein
MVKIRREEMEMVKRAASRVERRSNSRFVIDESRVEVTEDVAEDDSQAVSELKEDDSKEPFVRS